MTVEMVIGIVENTLQIDLTDLARSDDLTDARMIVWKISSGYGHGPSKIARAMNRDHSCIYNYKNKFDFYLKNKAFKFKYQSCLLEIANLKVKLEELLK